MGSTELKHNVHSCKNVVDDWIDVIIQGHQRVLWLTDRTRSRRCYSHLVWLRVFTSGGPHLLKHHLLPVRPCAVIGSVPQSIKRRHFLTATHGVQIQNRFSRRVGSSVGNIWDQCMDNESFNGAQALVLYKLSWVTSGRLPMIKVVGSEHYSSNIPALHKILNMSAQAANAKLCASK